MTKGQKIKEKILNYINDARKEHSEITDDMLCENGAVYYMNRNDGTYFDWQVNHRLCEFFLFYEETELGFIKVCISKRDMIYGYMYLEKGNSKPIRLEEKRLEKGDANYLRKLLLQEADHKGLYDMSIDKIDFSSPIRKEK